ncbi:hypothetical protein BDL97_03G141300 [Sphagnum fallax]|nr:hypothetical protein BDL97_03G141300 [Sphagnum fallax]
MQHSCSDMPWECKWSWLMQSSWCVSSLISNLKSGRSSCSNKATSKGETFKSSYNGVSGFGGYFVTNLFHVHLVYVLQDLLSHFCCKLGFDMAFRINRFNCSSKP